MHTRTATFIGHSECLRLSDNVLLETLAKVIEDGYRIFLNGGMGQFDLKCARCIQLLKREYEDIQCLLVVPYLSFHLDQKSLFDEVVFPEEMEGCHYKAAIPKRNKYLVDHSELAICYINHDWGGAAKTYAYACKCGIHTINLGVL